MKVNEQLQIDKDELKNKINSELKKRMDHLERKLKEKMQVSDQALSAFQDQKRKLHLREEELCSKNKEIESLRKHQHEMTMELVVKRDQLSRI